MKKLLFFIFTMHCALCTMHCSAQWVQTNGPDVGEVLCIAISDSNVFEGTGGNGILFSSNNGSSWEAVNTGLLDNYAFCLDISGQNIFAGVGAGIYLSNNNGTSWTELKETVPAAVYDLAISGPNIIAWTFDDMDLVMQGWLYLSTNNGSSWSDVTKGLPDLGFNSIQSIVLSGSDIFASMNEVGVLLSTDNGLSWTEINTGLPKSYVRCLAISGSKIFAGTENGIYVSKNNGAGWEATGLTNTGVECITINGPNILAGTFNGIYLSTNTGLSWETVNTGLTDSTNVNCLAIGDRYIFAGTRDNGVWKRPLSDFVLNINEHTNQTTEFKIYPNPVEEITNIKYQIPNKSQVTIKIYDIMGRDVTCNVCTLLDGVKEKGEYTFKYDASGLRNGVYFVKLATDDGSRVVKFVKD